MAKRLSATEIAALLRLAGTAGAATNITGVAASNGVVTVTATSHPLAAGDLCLQESVGGATEANGFFRVATKPDANTYTLEGLSAVTAYTSGGTVKKLTITGGLVRALKPGQLNSLADALNRRNYDRGTDENQADVESTLATILGA